jgi:hypothetical protein
MPLQNHLILYQQTKNGYSHGCHEVAIFIPIHSIKHRKGLIYPCPFFLPSTCTSDMPIATAAILTKLWAHLPCCASSPLPLSHGHRSRTPLSLCAYHSVVLLASLPLPCLRVPLPPRIPLPLLRCGELAWCHPAWDPVWQRSVWPSLWLDLRAFLSFWKKIVLMLRWMAYTELILQWIRDWSNWQWRIQNCFKVNGVAVTRHLKCDMWWVMPIVILHISSVSCLTIQCYSYVITFVTFIIAPS